MKSSGNTKGQVMKAYQWIMQNNQEMCTPTFFMTENFFFSKEEVSKYYGLSLKECLLTIIGPYKPSMVDGKLAEVLVRQR